MGQHQQQQQPPGSGYLSPKDSFNLLLVVLAALAEGLLPVTRHARGRDMPGIAAVFTCLLIPIWAAEGRSVLLLNYWWVWLAYCAFRRIETLVRIWRGEVIHSRDLGRPFFSRWLPERLAHAIEIFGIGGIGAFVVPYDQGLGSFLLAASFGVLSLDMLQRGARRRVQIELDNGRLEAESIRELSRGR